ncbi:T9SS type A sorting domain-containing protein [Chryseobacterium sp. c4a]|uniref:T9SS type A sorting domain-containing protein n=1 Tax=Chryseobacterium sp. c4a TaxID=1573582 RepID=UPI00135A13DA|nr:T9SS type A sorting domain-containing protein [Chryseobacterium sp. c4a]
MKKIITTGIVLYACSLINAQVTLQKDLSYGNNGEVTYNDNGGYSAHKFIGDQLLVAYTYLNIAGNNKYIKYVRLNSNGIPDVNFGSNGSFVDGGSLGSPSSLLDANADYLINYSDDKYSAAGQYDTAFQMNWATNDISGKKYIHILPNGTIIFRKDDNFTRILANGALDSSYGINGRVSTLSYSTTYAYGVIHNNFAYEFGSVDSNINNYGIRKLNIMTGNLESGYGNNGLGETSIVPINVRNSMYNEADGSMLNMLDGGSSQCLISKTKSNGFLDASFGNNGVFTLNREINSINYTPYSNFYADSANRLFFLLKSDEDGDIVIASYSSSGILKSINNQSVFNTGDNVYTNYSYGEYPNFQVIGNYLYFFSPKKIIRYIISEQAQVLSTESRKIEKAAEVTFENPFKNELTLHTKEKIKNVEIYNESGHLVQESKGLKLNTASLINGVYLIKITTVSNQIISKKAIKH